MAFFCTKTYLPQLCFLPLPSCFCSYSTSLYVASFLCKADISCKPKSDGAFVQQQWNNRHGILNIARHCPSELDVRIQMSESDYPDFIMQAPPVQSRGNVAIWSLLCHVLCPSCCTQHVFPPCENVSDSNNVLLHASCKSTTHSTVQSWLSRHGL